MTNERSSLKKSWNVSLSSTSVREGESIHVTAKPKKSAILPDRLSVVFTGEKSGINDADFQNSRVQQASIGKKSKSYKFSFIVSNDEVTEGSESGEFVLLFDKKNSYSGGALSKVLFLGPVTINDTSQTTTTPPTGSTGGTSSTSPPPTSPPAASPQEVCWEFENNIDSLYSQTTSNSIVKAIDIPSEEFNGFLYSTAIIGTQQNDGFGDENTIIIGTNGNDLIIGGEGIDFIRGGAGADIFYITKETTNGDHNSIIEDFNAQEGDVILLDSALFDNVTGFRSAAKPGSANNVFDKDPVKPKRRTVQVPALVNPDQYVNLYIEQFSGQFDASEPESSDVLAAIKTDFLSSDSIFILC